MMKILHFKIFLLIVFAANTGNAQVQYQVINLGTLPNGNYSEARDINDNGQVVGRSSIPGSTRAFLWQNGNMIDLGTLGGNGSEAYGINNLGQVVGYAAAGNGNYKAFLWQNGNMIDLGKLQVDQSSIAYSINNLVKIVGAGEFKEKMQDNRGGQRAFLWQNGNMIDLLGLQSVANDINDFNQIVGSYQTVNGELAFLWDNGNLISLGTLGGSYSEATAINALGQVVGNSYNVNFNSIAFLWQDSSMIDLGTIGGDERAYDINNSGQIVGFSQSLNRAWIWQKGTMTDLNTLIDSSSGWTLFSATAINNSGQIVGYGVYSGVSGVRAFLLDPQSGITNPAPYDKWIAGETDTIRWTDRGWTFVNIKCLLNYETSDSSEHIIENFYFADSSRYIWNIPDTLLSFRSKIIIADANNPEEKIESDIFRIKPYVLTRVTPDSIYYDYQKARDRWAFSNTQQEMWPPEWYQQQFFYRGTDPFTGLQYSQWQGDSAFARANHKDHVDWISWVNAFNVDFCYLAVNNGLYSFSAITKWEAIKGEWGGSCFGIAAANALAFSHRQEFQNKYPNYPAFINPISVVSDTGVKRVVNELFTHQYGNPSIANDEVKYDIITPNGTLNEFKQMLKEDNAEVKTLTIYNNSPGGGGHTILGYGLKRDNVQNHIYHIQVYDNSNPFSNNPITIDTTLNGGDGAWEAPDWPGWGGNKNIYLEIIDDNYLNNASFPVRLNNQSPFVLSENELEINNSRGLSIRIIDTQGNVTGFVNDTVLSEIAGSLPKLLKNGSETPPYGYHLSTNDYSVILNGFTEDTVKSFFFTGNKSFSYSRSGAEQKQTDRLFFDGGISAVNPDAQVKTVKLLNIINETTQEKLFAIRSFQLVQNDSVKIENPNENNLKLISYGSQKDYDIEINYVSQNEIGRFGNFNISLPANTSHTFVPDWQNLNSSMLVILVDIGNNGKIDDTLYINNTVDIEDQGNLLVPDKYDLAQNYPNPFNPITTIQYSILHSGFVSIKIYDVLGREVVTLVNEEKLPGVYEVKFDGSGLPSGVYFYRLETEEFVRTKKMVLMK